MDDKQNILKRKITDFFASQDNNQQPVAVKRRSFSQCDLKELKCPKTAIFTEEKIGKGTKQLPRRVKDKKSNQRVLDCGQKEIGNVFCEECNMVYCVDSLEDSQRHNLHHNRFTNTQSFSVSDAVFQSFGGCNNRQIGDHRVFYLGSNPPAIIKEKMSKWIGIVNEEVGYLPGKTWSDEQRVFVCISKQSESYPFLSGVLVVDRLNEAIEIESKETVKADAVNDWIVGVDRIWVHSSVRKNGIASALIDTATLFDREMKYRMRRLRVAFSDLTITGKSFAKRFVETRYGEQKCTLLY